MNKKRKIFYVRPQVEIYGLEPHFPLQNASFNGGHDDGGDDGLVGGAKSFNFSFSDPWESLDGEPSGEK